jgi:pimeloyl-ACP methyl ester carboxylesterase
MRALAAAALVGALAATVIGLLAGSRDAAAFAPDVTAAADRIETPRISGQRTAIAFPRQPTKKVVVFLHGTDDDANSAMDYFHAGATRLLEHGYAYATSTAHGDAWGNDAARDDYADLVAALRARGLTRVYVLAASMGGLDGLRLVQTAKPVAFAALFPVCNLRAMYRHGPWYRTSIRRAYGARRWRTIARRASGRSPVDPRKVKGLPMIFWSSPGDTDVPKRSNTDVCARNARERGARVTVVKTTGDHGDGSNFDPGRLTAFFDAAGPRS